MAATTAAPTRHVAELFVRGLGGVYAIAFASLGVQVVGLFGTHGIVPAADLLLLASKHLGPHPALQLPSWLWITGASDWALRGVCIAGLLCSLAVGLGRLPRVALLAAWSLYLSLCSVGQVFLSYQWDSLLLEAGLVGVFVATPGSAIGLWLARVLCAKLMLLSGIVKLLSGDPNWRNLSALSYHFWTQPLPAWPALLASRLPGWLLSGLTLSTLAIELVAPPLIFGPRRVRLTAAAGLAWLQVVIAATGSYGFFNLLSLLLCVALLDDAALLAMCPARLRGLLARAGAARAPSGLRLPRTRRALHLGLAAALLAASLAVAVQGLLPLPAAVDSALDTLAPLRSVNSYGLFAVMTTRRREIAIEGSSDGIHWRRYTFAWKPDAVDRLPHFATPHMPRLDWQMWFAALSSCSRQRWFQMLLLRILQGSPPVLSLFEQVPFPRAPPRYLRTPQALYQFAPPSAWLHGRFWVRKDIGSYCPPVTLRDGRLARARELSAGD